MKKIGLISDTHSYFGHDVAPYLEGLDELWHAGDIGNLETADAYENCVPVFRAVYGNIDGHLLRAQFDEVLSFTVENVRVLMMHIGGYPGRYTQKAREALGQTSCDLFISGHSHITKVMRDHKYGHLHMNPGSCGHHGIHIIRTFLRFTLDKGKIDNLEVVELGRRGQV